MHNIFHVQGEYLHSLNVSITEAIVKMSHVRFNGNIYFPPATKQDSAYNIFSFTHHVLKHNKQIHFTQITIYGTKKNTKIKLYEIYTLYIYVTCIYVTILNLLRKIMIRDNIYSAHKVRISNDDLGSVDNVRGKAGILSPVSNKLYEY